MTNELGWMASWMYPEIRITTTLKSCQYMDIYVGDLYLLLSRLVVPMFPGVSSPWEIFFKYILVSKMVSLALSFGAGPPVF